MYEMMFDLETLDTVPNAIVLSVGAVIFETFLNPATGLEKLTWNPIGRYYRRLNIQTQIDLGRSMSEATLLWWMQQDLTAREEALAPVTERRDCWAVLNGLNDFASQFTDPSSGTHNYSITRFWANPSTFDFPIWDSLAANLAAPVPWRYNQFRDVRTVVQTANLSVKSHVAPEVKGIPHMPIYDCEWQISLLTAARERLRRRNSS